VSLLLNHRLLKNYFQRWRNFSGRDQKTVRTFKAFPSYRFWSCLRRKRIKRTNFETVDLWKNMQEVNTRFRIVKVLQESTFVVWIRKERINLKEIVISFLKLGTFIAFPESNDFSSYVLCFICEIKMENWELKQ
jgi:hypothetical protein